MVNQFDNYFECNFKYEPTHSKTLGEQTRLNWLFYYLLKSLLTHNISFLILNFCE